MSQVTTTTTTSSRRRSSVRVFFCSCICDQNCASEYHGQCSAVVLRIREDSSEISTQSESSLLDEAHNSLELPINDHVTCSQLIDLDDGDRYLIPPCFYSNPTF